MNYTPLRYPGGKSLMTSFFIDLFKYNDMKDIVYVEPFAGGAGAAVNLLVSGNVKSICINDANVGIYSFWKSLVSEPERLIAKVFETPVTLSEWRFQRDIYKNSDSPSLELGFAVFFLSRTNRSGIISAGPIGGSSDEKQASAKYKIDCRFNKKDLIKRMERIAENANSIQVYNMDALDFINIIPENAFVYLDPPYFVKGQCLYMNHYTECDHHNLSESLKSASFKWLLSYDDVSKIREIYQGFDLYNFPLAYTASNVRNGVELITHSRNIKFPERPVIKRGKNNDIGLIKI